MKDEIEWFIRDETLRRFVRKDREERKTKLEIRNHGNNDNSKPIGVINVIISGPSSYKGKNKRSL